MAISPLPSYHNFSLYHRVRPSYALSMPPSFPQWSQTHLTSKKMREISISLPPHIHQKKILAMPLSFCDQKFCLMTQEIQPLQFLLPGHSIYEILTGHNDMFAGHLSELAAFLAQFWHCTVQVMSIGRSSATPTFVVSWRLIFWGNTLKNC